MTAIQALLWDVDVTPGPRTRPVPPERTPLAGEAWVDLHRDWFAGAGTLIDELVTTVPWRATSRTMYDRVVDVPRLQAFYGEGSALPHPALDGSLAALVDHYGEVSGGPFRTAGLCLYRDGNDSVAWHGDTIGRGATEDTMVAVLSIGATRRLLLRPRTGGPSLAFDVAGGDLLVMGGSCQRTWEHAVPKTRRSVGPRVSVQFRPGGVR